MKRPNQLVSFVGLLLFAHSTLWGTPPQQAQGARASQSAQPQPPILRTTTRMVQVPTIVTDSKRSLVAGLKADDFELFDNGHPQVIRFFTIQAKEASSGAGAPLPPDTFSNRLRPMGATPPTVTAILIDGLNTRFEDLAYARNEAVVFAKRLHSQEAVSLYILGRHLSLVHDFTTDTSSLISALQRYRPEVGTVLRDWTPSVATPRNATAQTAGLSAAHPSAAVLGQDFAIEGALQALSIIAGRLAEVPGRKNLIWISSSFPFPWERMGGPEKGVPGWLQQTAIDEMLGLMNAANIALYPVDPMGLVAPVDAGSRLPPRVGFGGSIGEHSTMNLFAERTGGVASYNTNDITGAIQRAYDDSRLIYVLGFYPPDDPSGRFHRISVKVKHSGVRVRARNGYFPTLEAVLAEQLRDRQSREARSGTLEAIGVGLIAHAELSAESDSPLLNIQLAIDPHDLQLRPDENGRVGNVFLQFTQRNAAGMILARTGEEMTLLLTPGAYELAQKEGIKLMNKLAIPPGTASVRIIVADPQSGISGSVTIPLKGLQGAPVN